MTDSMSSALQHVNNNNATMGFLTRAYKLAGMNPTDTLLLGDDCAKSAIIAQTIP